MSIVIIAEKASQAEKYAKVLKITTKNKGYYEGTWNGAPTYITYALGHLIEISEPAAQNPDWKEWKAETLPMIPQTLKLNLIKGKEGQFSVIKELVAKASQIINATDAGREGELIFGYIYGVLKGKVPVKRLWVQDQSDKSILQAFANLKDGKDFEKMFEEARCRAFADWLTGMNASRAISIASMQSFSLGRVQTPTLALICERYLQFNNFEAEPYWTLSITFPHENFNLKAGYGKRFMAKAEAEAIQEKIEDTTLCKNIEKEEKTVKPPLPFSLAELQKECNRKFHLSLSETMEIAQKLYETHQLTTYPRTDSAYLTENTYEELPQVMSSLALGTYGYLTKLLPQKYSKHCINDKKVTDHYAIIPTEKNDAGLTLSENERKVYGLIVKRTIEALMPDCIKDVTSYTFENAKEDFFAKGVVIRVKGWKEVEELFKQKNSAALKEDSETEEENEEETSLPVLHEFQTFRHTKPLLEEKETKAKPIHTGASLVTAMEHCSNEIEDDDEAKKALKASEGIGRPATRDSIVAALLDKELIQVKNKVKLFPTEKGLVLYKAVKHHSLASAKLTGQWEAKLSQIEKGLYAPEQFMADIKTFVQAITKELLEIGKTLQVERRKIGVCPKCKAKGVASSILEGKKSFYCQRFPDKECDFGIPREIRGVEIFEQEAVNLLTKGKTSVIKGFTFESKEGKAYQASKFLVLNEENAITLENPPDTQINVPCPKCKQNTLMGQEIKVFCKNTSCNYILYKSLFKRELPETAILAMLKGQKVLVKGFYSEAKKLKYDLNLFLNAEGKIETELPKKK